MSPIVTILSVYQGVVYSFTYLLFTTFPLAYRTRYGFGTGTIGLTYLGMGISSLIGLIVAGTMFDRTYRKKTPLGTWKAEDRLMPLVSFCFFIPVGLFWYGWAADRSVHWVIPTTGTVFMGVGVNTVMISIATYFIDAHPLYEASAAAALTAVRSLIGCLMPLFGRSLYQKMGLGWSNSLLGLLVLAMCPLPWVFYKYDELIRTKPRFQLQLWCMCCKFRSANGLLREIHCANSTRIGCRSPYRADLELG